MKISKFTKYFRSKLDLTIDELSVRSHLSTGFLSRLENGDYDRDNLSLESIIKLAKGLNISVKEILDAIDLIDQKDLPPINVYLRNKYGITDASISANIENIIRKLEKK